MQVEKKVLLAIVVLLWFPFYVVIQQWQVSVSLCMYVYACVRLHASVYGSTYVIVCAYNLFYLFYG